MGPIQKLRHWYAPKLSLLLAVNHKTEIEETKVRAIVTTFTGCCEVLEASRSVAGGDDMVRRSQVNYPTSLDNLSIEVVLKNANRKASCDSNINVRVRTNTYATETLAFGHCTKLFRTITQDVKLLEGSIEIASEISGQS